MSHQSTAGIQNILLHPKQAEYALRAGILTPEQITMTQPIPDTPESSFAESKSPKEPTSNPITLETLNSYLRSILK